MSFESIDIGILRVVNGDRLHGLDGFFGVITDSGPYIAALIPIGFLLAGLLLRKRTVWQTGLIIAVPYLISVLISQSLKAAIARPRPFITYPFVEKLSGGGSSSFPSGHTSDAFSVAMILCLLFPRKTIVVPALLWAILVGYSRVDLGVHYPSDVLGGAIIGVASSVSWYWFYRKRNPPSLGK